MLDKTLPYAEIWMTRPLQQNVPITPLAEGFEFRFYQKEDESAWAEIETSVGEFQTTDEALEYFQQNFAPYPEELEEGCFVETKRRKSSNLYRLAKNQESKCIRFFIG